MGCGTGDTKVVTMNHNKSRGGCLCDQDASGTKYGHGDTVIGCVDGEMVPGQLDLFGECPPDIEHDEDCPYVVHAGGDKTASKVLVCVPGVGVRKQELAPQPRVKQGDNTVVTPSEVNGQIVYTVSSIQKNPGSWIYNPTTSVVTWNNGSGQTYQHALCDSLAPLILGKIKDDILSMVPTPPTICEQMAALDEADPECSDTVLTLKADGTCARTRVTGQSFFETPIPIAGSNFNYGHNTADIDGAASGDPLPGVVTPAAVWQKTGEIVFDVCDALSGDLCNRPTHVTISARANATIFSSTNAQNSTVKVNLGGRVFAQVGQSNSGQTGGNNHNGVSPEFDWPIEADGCTVKIPYLMEANINSGSLDEWRANMSAVIRGAFTAV